jgi:hypothetical protein
MWRWSGQLLHWLACHLVAIGFLAFLFVAVWFRGPLFGVSEQAVTEGTPAAEVTESTTTLPAEAVNKPSATDEADSRGKVVAPTGEGSETTGEAGVAATSSPPFRPLTAEERALAQRPAGAHSPETSRMPPRLRPLGEGEIRLPADALLKRARAAFWDGQPQKAEALYLRYLQMRPDDANGFGELGNLYQSMERTRDALDAYYEAGVRLRAAGNRKQLAQIVEWLEKAGDPRARELGAQ